MGEAPTIHTYNLDNCVAFSLPKEPWGALSNFSPAFALHVNGMFLPTTEHLYQACRFPHVPELQARLLANPSPRAAKMRAHKHVAQTRPDWADLRVPIMGWCLTVKLAQHRATFGALLLESGSSALVEVSRDDAFWGAVPDELGSRSATGANLLGNLLMNLRAAVCSSDGSKPGRGEGDVHEWVPAPPSDLGLQLLGRVVVGERAAPIAG